jgi:Flp pilus assembly protein TadG
MSAQRSRRSRREEGAVAIVVAISSLLMFGCAAMAVDLGNAYARKRTSQTQVDLAALAGGQLLPKGDATNQGKIADLVADYLNRNLASTDQGTVTAGQLTDNNTANGEITYPIDTQLKLVAPPSKVQFGFANVLGVSSTNVVTEATVEKRALQNPVGDVLPMWLPSTCTYGPVGGDTAPTTPPSASPTYSPTADGFTTDNKFIIKAISVPSASYGSTVSSIDVQLENADNSPLGTDAAPVKGVIAFTFGAPTSWAQPADPAQRTYFPVDLKIPAKSGGNNGTQTVTINNVGAGVTNTVGDWQVWGVRNVVSGTPTKGTSVFTKDTPQKFTVTGGGGQAMCNFNQRGNFGQLDSPRNGIPQLQTSYAYNVALGLDHKLEKFDPAKALPGTDITTSPECYSDNSPTSAKIDNQYRPGNNCIFVQGGNDPGGLTSGLLDGLTSPTAAPRLFKKPTAQRCLDNGRVAPVKADDGKYQWSKINRDTLSCYLNPGVTLSDLAKDGAAFDLVDKSIVDSPRFFYMPVVFSLDRADKKYIAIKDFIPAFITDETAAPLVPPAKTNATKDNGITMNGGGTQIFGVQVFAFNGNVVPTDPDGGDVAWFDNGRPVIRLVK